MCAYKKLSKLIELKSVKLLFTYCKLSNFTTFVFVFQDLEVDILEVKPKH